MRTTLTLDDDLDRQLRERAHAAGKGFKEIVNETLRAGLVRLDAQSPAPYRLRPVSMGSAPPEVDLRKALQLADALEDAETQRELERGR